MKRISRSQLLTLFYQIMVFNSILNSSQFSKIPYFPLFTRIVLLSLIFAGTAVWFAGIRKINKVLTAVVLILIAISLVVMKESNTRLSIIVLLYLMIIYRDVDPKQFCKKYVEAAVIAMAIVFMLCLIGIFPNEYRYRIASTGAVQNRYYLGFNTTTASANFAFHAALAYLFYKQEKFKLKDAVLIIIPSTILYILTDTRAAYFEGIFAMLIFGLLKVFKKDWFKKVIGTISIWAMPVFAGIELYIANNYTTSNPVYVLLDATLSHRLNWAVRAIKAYPIGLFGNNISWEAKTYTAASQLVDMFYLRCAVQYGLVFLFVIIIGFMGISTYFKKNENYFGCVIILTLAIHSITDPQLLEYACVPLLIMLLTGYKTILDSFKLRNRKKVRRIDD